MAGRRDRQTPDLFARPRRPGLTLDARLRADGHARILGVDEAGRGPLAGPVCAAVAWLGKGVRLTGLDDSKRLSEAAREALGERLRSLRGGGVAFGVGLASAAEIDDLGIRPANFLAMHRALADFVASGAPPPARGALLVIDGRERLPDFFACQQIAVVGGDGRSRSIAAASVLAKTTRDALLREAAERWPAYGFDRHKGYGTAAHLAALRAHGPCPMHRRSFAPVAAAAAAAGVTESVGGR